MLALTFVARIPGKAPGYPATDPLCNKTLTELVRAPYLGVSVKFFSLFLGLFKWLFKACMGSLAPVIAI